MSINGAAILSSDLPPEQRLIFNVFGDHNGRAVVWRSETRNGKPTKVPYRPSGARMAKSNDPRTWGDFAKACATLADGGFAGMGIMLGDLGDGRFLVGKDLDLCRDPNTGEISPWARDEIARWPSYWEISPSGTGVKGYGYHRGVPPEGRKEVTIDAPVPPGAAGSGHDKPEIGLYPGFDPRLPPGESKGRYFAVTGLHLDGTPRELCDVTAEYCRTLADFEARAGRAQRSAKANGHAAEEAKPPPVRDASEADDVLAALRGNDRDFAAAWDAGVKIGPGPDDSASGRDFSLAVWLKRAGIADAMIAAILKRYPHGQIGSGKLRGRNASRRLARILAEIRDGREEDPRPVIRLAGGYLHSEVERAERELGRVGNVYQRGSTLVRVATIADPTAGGIRRAGGTLVISPYERAAMRVKLTEAINFQRFDKRSEEWLQVNCPADLADALLASAGHWPTIPPLLGIVEAPTLRPDGTVLDQPGYDAPSGLYFADGGVSFPPVPLAPTRDDALRALDVLAEPFLGFPFKEPADRSVALAGVLTALVRRSIRAAPAIVKTAPKMGSGKTLLATVSSYIATGRPPAMMSQADDPEGERKRLFAILLEGAPVAVIDNVERAFASDAMCSILTEPMFKDRVLGVSRTASAPTCTTWLITGNNVTIHGDLTTRVLACRLDPECERPEEREFKVNLHEEVPRRRAEMAVAALTIIRAYLAAGSPRPAVPTFGRFEHWQEWCRFPLIWLGLADPCETRASLEERDPVRERLAGLSAAWVEVYDQDEATLATVIKDALRDPPIKPDAASDARARLYTAIMEVAGEGGSPNGRKLGWFLSKHEGRIEDGRRFRRGEERRTGALWRVETVAKSAGFAGNAGFANPYASNCQLPPDDTYRERGESNPQKPRNPRPSPPAGDTDGWADL